MKKELQQIESGMNFYVVNPCAFQLLEWKDDILVTFVYCSLLFLSLTNFSGHFLCILNDYNTNSHLLAPFLPSILLQVLTDGSIYSRRWIF
jgi:hypothetical protein